MSKRDRDFELLEQSDTSLLEVLDNLLDKGVVLHGDIVLGLADVDLVYLQLTAVLCPADRVLEAPRGSAEDGPRPKARRR